MEPYAETMAKNLSGIGLDTDTMICGLCGLSAIQMAQGAQENFLRDVLGRVGCGVGPVARRRKAEIAEMSKQKPWRQPDLVILMAGTNDLSAPETIQEIEYSIRELHGACHAEGVRTVCLSIPDTSVRKFRRSEGDQLDKANATKTPVGAKRKEKVAAMELRHYEEERFRVLRRKQVNGNLATWAKTFVEIPTSSNPAVPSLEDLLAGLDEEDEMEEQGITKPKRLEKPEIYINAASLLPLGPVSKAAGYWEKDLVHFSAKGSEEFGRRLSILLRPLVTRIRNERVLEGGEAAAPSLEAFMAAFDMEDELADNGDLTPQEAFEAKRLALETPLTDRDWEVEAALCLQKYIRARWNSQIGALFGGGEPDCPD